MNSCQLWQQSEDISLDDVSVILNANNPSEDYNQNSKIPIDESGCLDALGFLLTEAPYQYRELSAGYRELAEGYRFLDKHKTVMTNETKEIYSLALKMKNDSLCYKLKYSGLQVMKEKMNIQ